MNEYNTVGTITRANREKKEEINRLINECKNYTSKQADKFIDEFSFLKEHGFSLVKQLLIGDELNYNRPSYIVLMKKQGRMPYYIHFPIPEKQEMKCELVILRYCNRHDYTFEGFAKFLAEKIAPRI